MPSWSFQFPAYWAGSKSARSASAVSSAILGSAGIDADAADRVSPALGESVTEGTVTRWLKAEGDEVAVDEPLL